MFLLATLPEEFYTITETCRVWDVALVSFMISLSIAPSALGGEFVSLYNDGLSHASLVSENRILIGTPAGGIMIQLIHSLVQ